MGSSRSASRRRAYALAVWRRVHRGLVVLFALVILAPMGLPSVAVAAILPGWQIVATPADTHFVSASASSADDAWLIGYNEGLGVARNGVAYHWDGASWTLSPQASVGDDYKGVDALAPNDVWMVGVDNSVPLARHWDGTAWSSTNVPVTTNTVLMDVGAVSSTEAWAVGYKDASFNGVLGWAPAYFRWNGTAWSEVSPPITVLAALTSVDVRSSNDVWAGGYTQNTNPRPYMTHFDGSSWTQVSLPDVGLGQINGVAAFGASSALAVGWQGGIGEPRRTMVLAWDGASWTVESTPNLGDLDNELRGVDGTSANDVWAVGSERLDENFLQTLSLHREASGWSVVPTPNQPSLSRTGYLAAVTSPTSDRAFAGGEFIATFGDPVAFTSSMTLVGGSAPWGQPVPIQGNLTFSDHTFVGEQVIVIFRGTASTGPIEVGSAPTSDDGSFSFLDSPPAQGDYIYTARFLGDARWDGSEASDIGTLIGTRTRVRLLGRGKITFGQTIKLTADLGAHLDNDVVAIYAKRPGKAERLIAEGSVGADDSFAVKVSPGGLTRYQARFGGDTQYAPTTSLWHEVDVVPILTARAVDRDGTEGAYALYRYDPRCPAAGHKGCPTIVARLRPPHPGKKLYMWAAVLVDGQWYTFAKRSPVLDAHGRVSMIFVYSDRRVVGDRVRVWFSFPGDKDHLGTKSQSVYFRVV